MTTRNRESRIPITVLTGFLGAGKTTLLNRILRENPGRRIAVIENEFGRVGVDRELISGTREELLEMNNGCVCCGVRGDLIRILGKLMRRREKLDHILIETTGLADPGPVVQTFFADAEMRTKLRLDGVVTVVDAKHIWAHIDDAREAQAQIAFADVIILNKTDLVSEDGLGQIESRIREINAVAKIYSTRRAQVEIDSVLKVGGFNLDRALELDATFMEPEYPFRWADVYELTEEFYNLRLHGAALPKMKAVILSLREGTNAFDARDEAMKLFSGKPIQVRHGGRLRPCHELFQLQTSEVNSAFRIEIEDPGRYALFAEKHFARFQAGLYSPSGMVEIQEVQVFKANHHHDEQIASVGIESDGDLDPDKFHKWIGELLQTQGSDIFRTKGILSMRDQARRYVFQGVHMMLEGWEDRTWDNHPRRNQLVFIGRNLERAGLREGFRSCLA